MTQFLRKERRDWLVSQLEGIGCSEAVALKAADIPEGQEDAHMAAHGTIAMNAANSTTMDSTTKAFQIASSAIVLSALCREARDRKLSKDHFPEGVPLLNEFIHRNFELIAEMEDGDTTH